MKTSPIKSLAILTALSLSATSFGQFININFNESEIFDSTDFVEQQAEIRDGLDEVRLTTGYNISKYGHLQISSGDDPAKPLWVFNPHLVDQGAYNSFFDTAGRNDLKDFGSGSDGDYDLRAGKNWETATDVSTEALANSTSSFYPNYGPNMTVNGVPRDLGNVLIVQEPWNVGDEDVPDDDASGGKFVFEWGVDVLIDKLIFLDIERAFQSSRQRRWNATVQIRGYDENDNRLFTRYSGDFKDNAIGFNSYGDNSYIVFEDFQEVYNNGGDVIDYSGGQSGVRRLEIKIKTDSGAISTVGYAIPEPSTYGLIGAGMLIGLIGYRRYSQRKTAKKKS